MITPVWAVAILVALFAVLVAIVLNVRSQHKRNAPPPVPKDPRRTDTELMPRIDPNQKGKDEK